MSNRWRNHWFNFHLSLILAASTFLILFSLTSTYTIIIYILHSYWWTCTAWNQTIMMNKTSKTLSFICLILPAFILYYHSLWLLRYILLVDMFTDWNQTIMIMKKTTKAFLLLSLFYIFLCLSFQVRGTEARLLQPGQFLLIPKIYGALNLFANNCST